MGTFNMINAAASTHCHGRSSISAEGIVCSQLKLTRAKPAVGDDMDVVLRRQRFVDRDRKNKRLRFDVAT